MKRFLVLIAGSLLVAPASAMAGGDDTTPDTSVVYTNEGDPARQVILPPPMAVGAMRIVDEGTTTGRLALEGNQTIDTPIEVSSTASRLLDVDTVNRDGSYAGTVTFESHEQGIAQGGEFAADLDTFTEYAVLEGLTLDVEFAAAGDPVALTPAPGTTLSREQQAAIDEIVNGDRGVLSALPDEPIGLGAEWTAVVEYLGGDVVGEFALTSLVDGQYTIDFSITLDSADLAATQLPGRFQTAEGTVALEGTLSGDAKDPFTATRQATAALDVTYTGPDGELTLDIESSIVQTIEPA